MSRITEKLLNDYWKIGNMRMQWVMYRPPLFTVIWWVLN